MKCYVNYITLWRLLKCWSLNCRNCPFSILFLTLNSMYVVVSWRDISIFSSLYGFQTFPNCSIFYSNTSSFQSTNVEIIFELFAYSTFYSCLPPLPYGCYLSWGLYCLIIILRALYTTSSFSSPALSKLWPQAKPGLCLLLKIVLLEHDYTHFLCVV